MANACCYTVDAGYLFPTLVSAIQLRNGLPAEAGDVIIFCFGERSAGTEAFERICAENSISLRFVPVEALGGLSLVFGRFVLPDLLEDAYDKVIYLDGDTQIAGSIAPLLSYDVPAGKVVAVPDPMCVMLNRRTTANLAYFRSLGLPDAVSRRYANAGVLRFNATDWAGISREALDRYRTRKGPFRFFDQDAFNLAMCGRIVQGSFKWNFPGFFLNFGMDQRIDPRIYHFMSKPRPWEGPFPPWGKDMHAIYHRFVRTNVDVAACLRPFKGARYARYFLQQSFKKRVERLSWGRRDVVARIMEIEAEAAI